MKGRRHGGLGGILVDDDTGAAAACVRGSHTLGGDAAGGRAAAGRGCAATAAAAPAHVAVTALQRLLLVRSAVDSACLMGSGDGGWCPSKALVAALGPERGRMAGTPEAGIDDASPMLLAHLGQWSMGVRSGGALMCKMPLGKGGRGLHTVCMPCTRQ